jgi:hypothetical protein
VQRDGGGQILRLRIKTHTSDHSYY